MQNAPNGVRPTVFLKPPTTLPAGVLSFGSQSLVPCGVSSPGPMADLICGAGAGALGAAGRASDAAGAESSASSRSERLASSPLKFHEKVI